ncbi:glycosyltransferase [Desulfocurvibacter africanus]|uniref:glycosyltransferase family 2 protein n=1 Tax=Desulfocurvibacter africanus TaxID=873 RepID=UPI002FDAC065
MTPAKPLVSCIITTCNRARLLARAIDSALAQTYSSLEIVVVDDASTDETPAIMQGYMERYKNIQYLRHERRMGACTARNTGIRAAKGEYVAGLDDDDEWLHQRVEKMLAVFEDSLAFIYSDYYRRKQDRLSLTSTPSELTHALMVRGINLAGTQVLTRRSYLLEAGGFDPSLRASQDYDMWLRLLEQRPLAKGVDEPLMIVDASDRTGRISVDRRKVFSGKFRVYRKNKRFFDRTLRTERLYSIRKVLHPYPSLHRVLHMAPRRELANELRRWIKGRLVKLLRTS